MSFEITEMERSDIVENGRLITTATSKPIAAIIVSFIAGIALIFFLHNVGGYAAGAVMIAMSLYVNWKAANHKVLEIYDDAVILYSENDSTRAVRIPVAEIKEWEVNVKGKYIVQFLLNSGQIYTGHSYQSERLQENLQKVMPGRNSFDIRMEERRKKGFFHFGRGKK